MITHSLRLKEGDVVAVWRSDTNVWSSLTFDSFVIAKKTRHSVGIVIDTCGGDVRIAFDDVVGWVYVSHITKVDT